MQKGVEHRMTYENVSSIYSEYIYCMHADDDLDDCLNRLNTDLPERPNGRRDRKKSGLSPSVVCHLVIYFLNHLPFIPT